MAFFKKIGDKIKYRTPSPSFDQKVCDTVKNIESPSIELREKLIKNQDSNNQTILIFESMKDILKDEDEKRKLTEKIEELREENEQIELEIAKINKEWEDMEKLDGKKRRVKRSKKKRSKKKRKSKKKSKKNHIK